MALHVILQKPDVILVSFENKVIFYEYDSKAKNEITLNQIH